MSRETRIRRNLDKQWIPAEIHWPLNSGMLLEIEEVWSRHRDRVQQLLRDAAVDPALWPQHLHWNWVRKGWALRDLGVICSGLLCTGEWQGLMMTLGNRKSRLSERDGRNSGLIYVDYLEVASWNLNLRSVLDRGPEFSAVGTRLLQHAVELSFEAGFDGRISLHSLPISEEFYRQLGMTEFGPDTAYDDLVYFEMTPERAAELRNAE